MSEPSEPDELRKPGHWLLAKLGKRVLRPGGLELSRRLLAAAAPTSADRVVEFGPGAGKTAEILLAARPAQYTGVELNPDAPQALTDLIAEYPQARIIRADARATGLDEKSADLVVGEAMLTMQSMEDKRAIMAEAFRVLAPGGRYAIQELGFRPDDCPQSVMDELSAAISRLIKVGARPLTLQGWCQMLEECGFEVETRLTNPMLLLEPKRVIADEGLLRALRFFVNVRRNPAARTRIRAMRQAFRANQEHLHAVAIVARKPRR
ncbi:methyltransferase domain-containing protein [Trueperella pecoris]|uniref:Methyltransferase domain-containing protein n=1 Tax=Trueperella pecoris TaxID=2733571 RepID=A0A7M1R360_9ACTO|nr:class I SAM-dependent methyltransferase [Trueperella pecoris]QOR48689.1 methyltransferase domain-containing protein [Trueperella pecoris]